MAGAPGAGKSQGVSAVQQALGPQESHLRGVSETGYTTVDADDIKQILLGNPVQALELDPDLLSQARTHWEGVLSDNASAPLADGRPLARGELATLVHEMSTSTADQVRADLVADRFGIKIEGTLQWMDSPTVGQGPTLIRELERADYSQVTIVAIDTPEHMCLEGARTRWEIPRSQGDPTARYTPPAAVTGMFTTAPDGTRSCRCIDNARATHHLAARSAIIAQTDLFSSLIGTGISQPWSSTSPDMVKHICAQPDLGHARLNNRGPAAHYSAASEHRRGSVAMMFSKA